MTKTKNILLIILLALQIGLIAFLYRPGQNAAPAAASLFTSLAPEKLTSLVITNEQGKSLTLTKKDGWQLSPGDFPADEAKIEGVIKKLAALKSSRLVSQTKGSHARLKVADADFNRKVELGQGDSKTTFFLGTSPSAKSIHLRLADANEVYQANDLAAWEFQADNESWWQTRYLSQQSDKLSGLSISNAQGSIDLAYDAAQKAWQLKGAKDPATKLEAKPVETLLNSLMAISVDTYQAKDFTPKGKAIATVTYQGKDGDLSLQVWAKDKPEDGAQIIKASNSAFYAKAKDYVLKGLLEAKLDTLIAKPADSDKAAEAPTADPAAADQPPLSAPPDK